jgi:SGNH hydrolase-like domain, acetyltransferase AlgX
MPEHPCSPKIPPTLHVVNIMALLLGGVLLLLTAVDRTYQLLILVPVLGLLVGYWRLRGQPRVVAGYFGMALALLGWILICEHIVTLDNVLGTQISRRLRLGMRLDTSVLRTLHTGDLIEREPCCDDPLTWHYRPGSRYRTTFDCPTCNTPYETTVDETGYLNQPRGLLQRSPQIEVFVAGDSVLQGEGVPSVVEWLRPQIPLRLWNLSMAGYGPRQKVNAVLTYALPKSPQWLLVEFYGGNDLTDAIRDEVCASGGDLRCRYNKAEVPRRLAHHPVYRTIFEVPTDRWARLADYATENLTLATTRYLLDGMKSAIKQAVAAPGRPAPSRDAAQAFYNTPTAVAMAWPPADMRAGQWGAYLQAGMAATRHEYERLAGALAGKATKPTVILLYNPAPYEVYRGMWMDSNPQTDQTSAYQREALSAFAQSHGWRFLDLTEPFRHAVQARQVWLFGRDDKGHWSPQGTAIAADVLAAELLKVIDLKGGSN